MDTIRVKMCIGIGDLLFYSSMLNNVKDRYSKAIVYPDFSLLSYREASQRENYIIFVNKFCKAIFNDSYFVFDENIGEDRLDPNQIYTKFKIPPYLGRFHKELCIGEDIRIDEEYVVVNTKIRSITRDFYIGCVKNKFLKSLNYISGKYKIVLLGERETVKDKSCNEWGSCGQYSLYKDIIENIPQKHILDLTQKELLFSSPVFENLCKDCVILNKSNFVISIGGGGGGVLALCVSKVVNLATKIEWSEFTKCVARSENERGNFITYDVNDFIKKITCS